MDILGSILKSMDKPPTTSDKQKQLRKHEKEMAEKMLKKELEEKQKFRTKIEAILNKFTQDSETQKYSFNAMDKIYRGIVHDVAEVAGFPAFTIGDEGIDRHVVIYKREHAPSDKEIAVMRRGDTWDPEKAKELVMQQEQEMQLEREERKRKPVSFKPNSDYKEKYEHLIGKEAALEAAKKTETNKQYGNVPSENKKDQRSIEQTLADMQSRKRQIQNVDDEVNSSKKKATCSANEEPPMSK